MQLELIKEHRKLIQEQRVKNKLEVEYLKQKFNQKGFPIPPDDVETPSRGLLNDSNDSNENPVISPLLCSMTSGPMSSPYTCRELRRHEY